MEFVEATLVGEQVIHAGQGRGSGYAALSAPYVPAATLLGALVSAWRIRSQPGDAEIDALLRRVSVSDAYSGAPVPLDRSLCKYPDNGCPPTGHPWWQDKCNSCGGRPEPAKGTRRAPGTVTVTRTALDDRERARDGQLFARSGITMSPPDADGVAGGLHFLAQGCRADLETLGITQGQRLRIGAARSVAGACHIADVGSAAVARRSGNGRDPWYVRLELLTTGVFVDDYGFAADAPQSSDLARLGVPGAQVVRRFVRSTTAGGWNVRANRPKPEDSGVVAHSVFYLRLAPDHAIDALGCGLGMRVSDGCGWFRAETADDATAERLDLERTALR